MAEQPSIYKKEYQEIELQDGEPCHHPGCASHISHPCEICRRKGARGHTWIIVECKGKKK